MTNLENELRTISKTLLGLSEKLDEILSSLEAGNESIDTDKPQASSPNKSKKSNAIKGEPAKTEKVSSKAGDATGKPTTMIDAVYETIKNSRKGISIDEMKKIFGLSSKKLGDILYKLTKRGKVQTIERGVYIKAK